MNIGAKSRRRNRGISFWCRPREKAKKHIGDKSRLRSCFTMMFLVKKNYYQKIANNKKYHLVMSRLGRLLDY